MAQCTCHPPNEGLFQKFDAGLADAVEKWERQDDRRDLYVFFELVGLDFGTSPPERVLPTISAWARRGEARTNANIVVCYNYAWDRPFFPPN